MITAGAILIVLAIAIVLAGGVVTRPPAPKRSGASEDNACPRCGRPLGIQTWLVGGEVICEACAIDGGLPQF